MPAWYFKLSSIFTRRKLIGGIFAVVLLAVLVAVGFYPGAGIRARSGIVVAWWLLLAIVWFDSRQRSELGAMGAWSRALVLDLLALLAVVLFLAPERFRTPGT
jgi:hypothetical protein